MNQQVKVGMNGRFFPNNWRPAFAEIDFAAANQFEAIQFPGPEDGLSARQLGSDLAAVGDRMRGAGITPVMEIVVRVDRPDGRTASGRSPLDLLEANLPAIEALGCACAHWHLVLRYPNAAAEVDAFEDALRDQLFVAVERAERLGVRFGIEQNEPEWPPYRAPDACARALEAIPGLGFVWDMNHALPDDVDAYLGLAGRMQMLHVADTPLPVVNYHLPLGLGRVDFDAYFAALLRGGFSGPAILEIGGLPKSGGYGRDTDAALIDSARRLRAAIEAAGVHSG
ncbi:MAG TPA: TIM barrel protein [Thermoflexales bacterium]|jgi:sugar phosphate isomerase/epimerase|nr:TIM barrel protein [Thermoflexales bacterium]HQX11020.1 TIM barrel protein [Thermoflexales bacterium]HQY24768.1 TIM barrel protein [Thermoflexales bacterium]HQZ53780.1 TIM barrel protein [Thermoflexales bacterium]